MPQPEFADVSTAREVIKKLYPNATHVELVEHGYDNIVGLVDHAYAVRFPRDTSSFLRSQYERNVLAELEGVKTSVIPRVIGDGNNPPYIITTFLEGAHCSLAEIRTFTEKEQIEFGNKIAEFAYEMHSRLPMERVARLRKQFGLDDLKDGSWDAYLRKLVGEDHFGTVRQTALAKEWYLRWQELCPNATVAVHDDLHVENMLFQDHKLIGILDFGETNVGSPEQEFRQLYRINDFIPIVAIRRYEEISGKKLNAEVSRAWAIVQELASYAWRLSKHETGHPSFLRATKNLNLWLPEGEWGIRE